MYRLYKILDFVRFDVLNFLKNIWKFRKTLLYTRPYEYNGIFIFMETCTNDMVDHIEKYGYEILTSRQKKVQKIRRVNEILKNIINDNYIEMAEAQLGKIEDYSWGKPFSENEAIHIKNVLGLAEKIENEDWAEFIEILRGQDYSTFDPSLDFNDQFDGSGLRTWWD